MYVNIEADMRQGHVTENDSYHFLKLLIVRDKRIMENKQINKMSHESQIIIINTLNVKKHNRTRLNIKDTVNKYS